VDAANGAFLSRGYFDKAADTSATALSALKLNNRVTDVRTDASTSNVLELMVWKKIVFERQSLFDEVWEQPMLTLAERYRLSDVGLRKICVALEIPLPPRGYWARAEARRRNKKPTLQTCSGRTIYEHMRFEAPVDETLDGRMEVALESAAARKIGTPEYTPTEDPNELQEQSRIIYKAMRKGKASDGILTLSGELWADIEVSKNQLPRAIQLIDQAAYELKVLGAYFENSLPPIPFRHNGARKDPNQKRNCFSLHGHEFFLRIREKITTESLAEEPSEKRHNHSQWSSKRPQLVHTPTGELQLCIVDVQRYYERYKIHDSSRGTIELKMRKVLAEAEEGVLRRKLEREIWNEREEARRAKARDWESTKENKNKLLAKLALVETMAKDLDRARSIRRFIAEVDATKDAPPELLEGRELMTLMADWLDPLVKAHWPGVDGVGDKNPFGSP
jgi:hypothetical protein